MNHINHAFPFLMNKEFNLKDTIAKMLHHLDNNWIRDNMENGSEKDFKFCFCVICSLVTIPNWENKIQSNFHPGEIPYFLFHGEITQKEMKDAMVMMKTYGMIGKCGNNLNILKMIEYPLLTL
ncbi:uncharacterized protein VP01_8g12 [Puccinia sorghi]|uniref:Uncharacterized protein n=1 Tax=Puccinia sorghi TaxID=27349 RepID=A0A0L6U8G8_9BASI|nr:uncharacterized protein VP01_8g12 [Puccinia sorghi]